MRFLHSLLAAAALSLFAPAALAAAPPPAAHAKFPMKAADFQKQIDERLAKGKARLEERLKKNNVPEAKAKEVRARFEAHAAETRKATADATKDGTVTKEEAKAVRKVAHAGGHGHPGKGGRHHRHGGKHAKK